MEYDRTVNISLGDAKKLGLTWSSIADGMGYDVYAVKEGKVDDESMIRVPISLINPKI